MTDFSSRRQCACSNYVDGTLLFDQWQKEDKYNTAALQVRNSTSENYILHPMPPEEAGYTYTVSQLPLTGYLQTRMSPYTDTQISLLGVRLRSIPETDTGKISR